MAAPLPPDMENESQRTSRKRSALSVGFMGFALGTAFGVGLGVWLSRSVNGTTIFFAALTGVAVYWLLARFIKK